MEHRECNREREKKDLDAIGRVAVQAKYKMQLLDTETKNRGLQAVAEGIKRDCDNLLAENEKDVQAGRKAGMNPGLLDRLKLDEKRIEAMAEGIMQVAGLTDPVGNVLEEWSRPNGLRLKKISVPIGVIAIIYESRPNVTADAFALCFKAGNVVILKGGKEALHSNRAITASVRRSLKAFGLPEDGIQLMENTDRETTRALMRCNQYVDLLIPRGSAGLIKTAVENSTVPIIETGTGNCHIYIDESADLTKAVNIVVNAKTQRIGVCNACESLVLHSKIADQFLPLLEKKLAQIHPVEIRGDENVCRILEEAVPAKETDYGREYLDYVLSAKCVDSVEEAIDHINQYSSGHSEAIIMETKSHGEAFTQGIDSACVYVNASTRFTDGFEFGFGAEIGISTQKLHARGPMGLRALTSYKYIIEGDGQVRP